MTIVEKGGLVECKICGESFLRLTNTHLRYAHGVSNLEYGAMFPGVPTISEESSQTSRKASAGVMLGCILPDSQRESISKSLLGRKCTWGEKISVALTGVPKSEEHKLALSKSLTGRTLSKAHREHMSEAMMGRSYGPLSEEHKLAIRTTERTNWENPEFVARMVRARRKTRPTLDETLVSYWILVLLPVEGWVDNTTDPEARCGLLPDFFNDERKQIIEVFGTYWHSQIEFPDKRTEQETIDRYRKGGYTCLVLWGDEIYNRERVLQKFKEVGFTDG